VPPSFRPLLAALLCAALASCRAFGALDLIEVPDAKAWNLEELHDADGHAYSVDLTGDVEYLLRRGRRALSPGDGGDSPRGSKREGIRDPERACLKNLVALARFGPRRENVARLQVMWCCRCATECPWSLSRERAVLELGEHARRLGVGTPLPLDPDRTPVGPDELAQLVGGLIAAVRPALSGGEPAAGAVGEACERLRAASLDVAGGRRVLSTLHGLLGALARGDGARAPLAALNEEVQVACVSQTLAAALRDPAPRVRAAALRASVRSAGKDILGLVLAQLEREPSQLVVVEALRLVGEHGLPEPGPELPPETARDLRERQLWTVARLALEDADGRVRAQAMLALAAVGEAPVGGLSELEWERWWRARSPAGPPSDPGNGL